MPVADDARAWQEVVEIVADDLSEEQVAAFGFVFVLNGESNDACEVSWDGDDGVELAEGAVFFGLEFDDEVEGFVEELGEGVGLVESERGEDGADFGLVELGKPLCVLRGEFVGGEEADAVGCEGGDEFFAPEGELIAHHAFYAESEGAKGFGGGSTVAGAFDDVGFDLLFEAGDSDFEELVEV